MKRPVLAIFILLSASPCWSQIGETVKQCTSRYGEPFKDQGGTTLPGHRLLAFRHAGFEIRATFYEEICDGLTFWHTQANAEGQPLEMSETDIKTFWEENGGGANRIKSSSSGSDQDFTSNDGKLFGRYNPDLRSLLIAKKSHRIHQTSP